MQRLSPNDARERIVEMVGTSVYQALALKESLDDEHRALERQDMEALGIALDNKSVCVQALQTLEQERHQFCVAMGFAAGPEQMVQLTEWCDENSVLADSWQHLLDIAIECNALNFTNGAIIRARKQQIEAGLAVIRGSGPESGTYGRSGRAPSGPSQRALAEA